MFEAGRRAALWYVNVTVIKLVRRSMIMKIFVWTRSCFTVHNYLRGPGQTLHCEGWGWRRAGVSIHNLSPQRTGDCRQWSDEGTLGDSGDPPAVIYGEAQHWPCSPLLAAAGWAGSVYLRILMANQDISDCNPPPCACEDSWESWWWWYSCFPLAALTTNAERDR